MAVGARHSYGSVPRRRRARLAAPVTAAGAVPEWLLISAWLRWGAGRHPAGSGTGVSGSALPASAISAWAVTHTGVWSLGAE